MTPPAYPHQLEGVVRAVRGIQATGGYLLAHAAGVGKTRTALGVSKALKAERILVVGPVSALGVWQREVAKWWPLATSQVLRGSDFTPFDPKGRPHVLITNYDQLGGGIHKRIGGLKKWQPQLLVIDEAHYIKGPTAARTSAIRKLSQASQYRLLLTGTPAHSPVDWWSQLKLVAPDDPVWRQRFSDYRRQVCVLGGPDQNWIVGTRQQEYDRVKAQHVLPYTHIVDIHVLSLPEPVETVVPVQLDWLDREAYDLYSKDETVAVLARMIRMQQLTGSSKADVLCDLIDQRPDRGIVVAFRYLNEITESCKLLCASGRRHWTITGNVSPNIRSNIEAQMQRADCTDVLLIQHQAGGEALTLTGATTLVFYSYDWSSIRYRQVIGRLWRSGQTKPVEILHLVAEGTIDEAMLDGLKKSLSDNDLRRYVQQRIGL